LAKIAEIVIITSTPGPGLKPHVYVGTYATASHNETRVSNVELATKKVHFAVLFVRKMSGQMVREFYFIFASKEVTQALIFSKEY
jgi:hypothetical protein